MSLRIRLSRVGAKKQASYRIVVADSTAPRDGKAIAILGHYNPLTDPYTLKVDQARAVQWLTNGAQPSDTARGLLAKAGVISAYQAAREAARARKAARPAEDETRARRAARAKRTEPPRLARPTRSASAVEVAETPAAPKRTAAKGGRSRGAESKAGSRARARSSRAAAPATAEANPADR